MWRRSIFYTARFARSSYESRELENHLRADQASVKQYKELHHFRIFLEEAGCHEFLAESAHAL